MTYEQLKSAGFMKERSGLTIESFSTILYRNEEFYITKNNYQNASYALRYFLKKNEMDTLETEAWITFTQSEETFLNTLTRFLVFLENIPC